MAEPERKCSTCKFYEPAPIWRKGWCRNPLLYAPQQSHLVAEDDLDCSRGLSDYWEAADGTGPNAGVNVAAGAGGDLFGRGAGSAGGYGATSGDDATRTSGGYGSTGGYGGYAGAGGYGSVGQPAAPLDDDDGYAPQENTGNPPASQPRYLGSVGDDAGEVRNPWNNAQPGFAAPPPESEGGYGGTAYGTDDAGNGAATGGYGNDQYGSPAKGDERGYGQQGAGYGDGGYGQQGAYGQQGGYAPQAGGYGTDPGYAPQGGGNAYDAGYGAAGAAAPGPTPATNGSRSQTAGSTQGGRRATPTPQGRERALTYYTEERYWTDYAKLAVPVVIVIALLGGIWFIGAGRLRGNGAATATPGGVGVAAVGTGTAASGTRPTGSVVIPGVGSVGAGTAARTLPPIVAPGTGTPGAMAGATPRAMPMLPAVMVQRYKVNSQGGANMRAEPKVGGAAVALVPDGTEVEGTGDMPQTDASGAIWYKVKFGDKTGWIRSDLFAAM